MTTSPDCSARTGSFTAGFLALVAVLAPVDVFHAPPARASAPEDQGQTAAPTGRVLRPRAQVNAQTRPEKTPEQVTALLRRLTSDILTRVTLERLRAIEAPTIEQYRAAALGLRIACRYAPDDAELLRQQLEAWESAQDRAAVLARTRELVRLDPSDTVALLRVATAGIANLQNADLRLKAYESLIRNEALNRSVRSRLALDSALLARETGDERGFLDKLTLSTTLDSSYKEAVALYVTYFLDRTRDPKERFDLLCMLLLADPLDAEAHRNTAYELRSQGAYSGGSRFLEIARAIDGMAGEEQTLPKQMDFQLNLWESVGPEKCLEELQRMVDLQRVSEDLRRARLRDSGRDPGPPVDVRLPIPLERLRLMIYVARSDDAGAAQSMDSIEAVHNEALRSMADNPPTPEQVRTIPPEQRPSAVRRARVLDWVWMRLFAGIKLDKIESDIEELSKPGDDDAPPVAEAALQRFRGWLACVKGELGEAKKILEPLAESDPSALWALAVTHQRLGDKDKALSLYEQLTRREPASALGSTARLRWERLRGEPMPPVPGSPALSATARSFAPWMEALIQNPTQFQNLTISASVRVYEDWERPELTIQLKNVSRIPLAVGSGKPINPRMLVSGRVVLGGREVSGQIRPEVVMMTRRLRLEPGETMEAKLWPGRGDLSKFLESRLTSPADIRFSVTQGFVFSQDRQFRSGPNCLRAQTDLTTRVALSNTVPAAELAERVLNQQSPDLLDAIALACYRVSPSRRGSDIDPVPEQDATTLNAAIAQRFPSLLPAEKSLCIARLAVSGAMDDAAKSRIVEALAGETDAGTIAVALLVLAKNADDPITSMFRPTEDPELAEFVSLVKSCFSQSAVGTPRPAGGAEDAFK